MYGSSTWYLDMDYENNTKDDFSILSLLLKWNTTPACTIEDTMIQEVDAQTWNSRKETQDGTKMTTDILNISASKDILQKEPTDRTRRKPQTKNSM